MKYLVFVFALLFISCGSHNLGKKIKYIDPDNITINGVLKLSNSYNAVVSLLGKSDSTVNSFDPKYEDTPNESCYFKNLVFAKQKDTLFLENILFKNIKNNYLQCPQMKFDSSTKSKDVEQVFDYEDASGGSDVDIKKTLFVRTSKNKTDRTNDGYLMLDFDTKTDKLYKISIIGPQAD